MSPEAVGAANVVIITAARLFLIPPTSVSVLDAPIVVLAGEQQTQH